MPSAPTADSSAFSIDWKKFLLYRSMGFAGSSERAIVEKYMSDAALTLEESRRLIHELATNDAFRERFEEKPAAALVELGIPFHVVVNLKATCLSPRKLASKKVFEDANRSMDDDIAQRCAGFFVPSVAIKRD